MPTITLPYGTGGSPGPFTDGSTSDAEKVAENLYAPNTTPDSYDVINGQLTEPNRDSWDITTQHIQPGALGGGGSVGSTTSLDFFGTRSEGSPFGEWNNSGNDRDALYRTIPGAARTFYLDYSPGLAIVRWRMFISNSGVQTSGSRDWTLVKLFVNGATIGGQIRTFPPGDNSSSRDGTAWDRTWSGFHWLGASTSRLSAGWNTVSLRIATDAGVARVHVKGLDVVYFK